MGSGFCFWFSLHTCSAECLLSPATEEKNRRFGRLLLETDGEPHGVMFEASVDRVKGALPSWRAFGDHHGNDTGAWGPFLYRQQSEFTLTCTF